MQKNSRRSGANATAGKRPVETPLHPSKPTRSIADRQEALRYALICVCFALSGLAALIYQTAWTRQFALVFGTSELAVATVLAAYMGGLALGARGIEYLLPRVSAPVRLYALLELGIGASALLLVPLCLRAAEALLITLLGGQPEPPATGATSNTTFYLIASFATLLVPTTLMGATLPLLARDGVHDDRQIGSRIGTLYACNTAGAVAGALLGALVLLPALGLRATIWVAAGINVLVFLLAWWLAVLRAHQNKVSAPTPVAAPSTPEGAGPFWILPLILLSGSVSFMQEVMWTRLLSRVVGSSIQSFGIMVASFLTGIAIGGALGARLARRRETATVSFVVSQVAVALALVLSWYALMQWAAVPVSPLERTLFGFVVLLPLTIAIGTTYPLAVRVLASGVADAPRASARVYGWNTAGAIVGALAGGFWLIPALRYEGAMHLSVVVSLVLALLAAISLLKFDWRVVFPLGLSALLTAALFRPAMPEALLRVSPLRSAAGTIVHYDVGRSADVVVIRDDSKLDLRTNGLPEAGAPVLGAPPIADVEAWMSMLAVLARPDLENMLIVGLGGGNVAQAVPPSVRRIDVVELEPKVIDANRAMAPLRLRDPLADPRLNLIVNDARGALALTDRKYDAIVSQPSHPWTAGASHLYTREFMRQVHDHLGAGGVFVQWMSTEFTDESLLRSLVATLLDVYHEVRVYRPSSTTLLFMASDQPIDIEHHPALVRTVLDRAPLHYARLGLNAVEDLVTALAMETASAQRFAASAPLLTDDQNRLATANVYARGLGLSGEQVGTLLAPYDPLTDAGGFIYRNLAADLSFEYIWRRAVLWAGATEATLQRMNRVAELLGDTDVSRQLSYMMAMHLKQFDIGNRLLQDGLRRWPNSVPLLFTAAEQQLSEAGRAISQPLAANALSRLPAQPAMVLNTMRDASSQDWPKVMAADAALATVPWTAQWGLQAAQLRVEWRMRVNNPGLRQRYGDEGIAIADLAEVAQPDVYWHALRARSAVGTNRPEVVLESAAIFCATVEKTIDKLADNEKRLVGVRAAGLVEVVKSLDQDNRVDAERVRVVLTRLQSIVGLTR